MTFFFSLPIIAFFFESLFRVRTSLSKRPVFVFIFVFNFFHNRFRMGDDVTTSRNSFLLFVGPVFIGFTYYSNFTTCLRYPTFRDLRPIILVKRVPPSITVSKTKPVLCNYMLLFYLFFNVIEMRCKQSRNL
jgi:hypothetical protein